MKSFYWETLGTGNINLILIHGWGFNSQIWFFIIKEFSSFCKIYLIDLPGHGKNKNLPNMEIDEIVQKLRVTIPKNSIWIGWSIGGLIASRFALLYPKYVLGIITISSSPCFILKKNGLEFKKNK
ncbi:alpha/beta fold hydrolase [Buchnera aphidicola (Muscaphis stroyani)]|uniref:Alpha/beta fold hydrolase n=1 Tax=Buchnera aphidicola (Muscaphis stroyani) TaxID=1241869 RepID=A0A4D6Y4G4_9GAMM|nr:alpha/beta fold hydrolase [Buchnera aphidicola]QCI24576.1 alpha/beta fold hydrolase [Buchnera aphidicola (Muscaphis stroyani)]